MENSQTCAPSVVRDDDEDVSKRQDGHEDEEVDETPEDAGVEDDEDGDKVATDMRNPCYKLSENVSRDRGWQGATPCRKSNTHTHLLRRRLDGMAGG